MHVRAAVAPSGGWPLDAIVNGGGSWQTRAYDCVVIVERQVLLDFTGMHGG